MQSARSSRRLRALHQGVEVQARQAQHAGADRLLPEEHGVPRRVAIDGGAAELARLLAGGGTEGADRRVGRADKASPIPTLCAGRAVSKHREADATRAARAEIGNYEQAVMRA